MLSLDLDQLRTFVVVADLRSFTAAAQCLNTSQSAVSLRLGKLEDRLQRRLLARSPRAVSLTPDGLRFLDHARSVIRAHDEALAMLKDPTSEAPVLRMGVSDHAVGTRLPAILTALRTSLPGIAIDVLVGLTTEMRRAYDAGDVDVAILRHAGAGWRDGVPIGADRLSWFASADTDWRSVVANVVPLVVMRGDCGVKAAALQALENARLRSRICFAGGSVAALQAAVQSGLGIGIFGIHQAPTGCRRLGPVDGLPDLPVGEVTMVTRLGGDVPRVVAAAFGRMSEPSP
jgi:DNA-binding transcriptional LysR family regulator